MTRWGAWLHRVAYRIALRANAESRVRRAKEAAVVRFERGGNWDDWIPVLHEEIDRMPETHRAPVVLCDLQELTYEQAAQQLRWTVPTLRCRPAKARERLRGRLTRRGLTGAGATLGILLGSARAKGAVPLASIQAATRLAVIEHRTDRIRTDAEGRFRIQGLAPGLTYRAYTQAPQGQRVKERIDIAAVTSGETRDLGDITITFQGQAD